MQTTIKNSLAWMFWKLGLVHPATPPEGGGRKPPDQPPDLDQIWQDFVKQIENLFGKKGNTRNAPRQTPPPNGDDGNPGGGFNLPPMPAKRLLYGVLLAIFALWLLSGLFIVREGYQGVVTQFGRYQYTVGAGLNWRIPYPFQDDEVINATQIRTVEVGSDAIIPATGLRNTAMLTADENIVEIKFSVQYRLKDARAYIFETADPDYAVLQTAETAVREVVGKMKMDEVLSNRALIAPQVKTLMQSILDKYQVGVDIAGINLSQDGVRPPEQVKAAFDDVLKASQEAERRKNEAEAYANIVIPKAKGTAARLTQEAEGYSARVTAQAQGDAQRFNLILPEYRRSPQAVRDRMYIDTMQQVYSNTSKIIVDAKQGMLYLPLDQIIKQQNGQIENTGNNTGNTTGNSTNNNIVNNAAANSAAGAASSTVPLNPNKGEGAAAQTDTRSRDNARGRDREVR